MNTVEIIVHLIEKRGITEKKFLSDLDFNRTLLSDWKSGKSKSYTKYLQKIADYFNVSTDYLLTGKELSSNRPENDESQDGIDMEISFRGGDGVLDDEETKDLKDYIRSTIDVYIEKAKKKNDRKNHHF